jgi:hypothetical protein
MATQHSVVDSTACRDGRGPKKSRQLGTAAQAPKIRIPWKHATIYRILAGGENDNTS